MENNHPNTEPQEEEKSHDKSYGVLLYYKYTNIQDVQQLFNFYNSNCTSLHLLGRVRLSSSGVNVTVGGKMTALEKHIDSVRSNSLFEGTDFKLASCSEPLNDTIAMECGFTSLSIRIVKELVTFSPYPLLKPPEVSNAGCHLSAAQFHSVLQNAGRFLKSDDHSSNEGLVLLDARNLYETRIGKFDTPDVKTLDPEIRQYSDLPSWIDDNSERLRGNKILMYCTGGIRCEMASAYIKSKGAGFENVFQLYGGIQRYLEQFPDGGFFKGKNFVFDHRVSVGSMDPKVLGSCLLCSSAFDDYSSRSRCMYCRMLVLVCDSCRKHGSSYVCELCQKYGKNVLESHELEPAELEAVSTSNQTLSFASMSVGSAPKITRKLRILCLHGFRQNASSFKGRTGSLAKKLKNIAELIFVDAPHELSFIYHPYQLEQNSKFPSSSILQTPPPSKSCNKKYAWLVSQSHDKDTEAGWRIADIPFDPLQYQQQTEGLDVSLAYLEKVVAQSGPFDGVLGFSQGAAMTALLCQDKLKSKIDFRFVILCSGFSVNMGECQEGAISFPSLHIFGNGLGKDRQIERDASRNLASLFEGGCSVVIEHELGHIIPTRSPYIDEIKEFLQRFL